MIMLKDVMLLYCYNRLIIQKFLKVKFKKLEGLNKIWRTRAQHTKAIQKKKKITFDKKIQKKNLTIKNTTIVTSC